MAEDSADRVAMWQTYVQTAENTSSLREVVNRYMVFVHLAIFSAHFALPGQLAPVAHILISTAGFVVAGLWIVLLDLHGRINAAKCKIIQELEADLPFQPITAETKLIGIGSRRSYLELSMLQMVVAWVVLVGHVFVMLYYMSCHYSQCFEFPPY